MSDTDAIDPELERLDPLVGAWDLEATHPAVPGIVVRGTADVAWLEGKRFLVHRAQMEHPDFPSSISILGRMDRDRVGAGADAGEPRLAMHYFDSRGVFRVFELSVEDDGWGFERLAPGFSQRFRATFLEGGDVIEGRWMLCKDGAEWRDDLAIAYRRHR